MNSFWRRLRRLDAYPKTVEDFRIRTFAGGAVTIIAGFIMFFLFLYELRLYLSTQIIQELFVDTSRGQKIRTQLNITFPRIPCDLLTIDVLDVSGSKLNNAVLGFTKRLVYFKGTQRSYEDFSNVENTSNCGSCYGARDEKEGCCNSCDDVRIAFALKNWYFNETQIQQCIDEANSTVTARTTGCEISGEALVNKVSGILHILPGRTDMVNDGDVHVHKLNVLNTFIFNTSHIIDSVSFGYKYPTIVNPLDGVVQCFNATGISQEYFVKIVPTVYQSLNKTVMYTNQYSVTKYARNAQSNTIRSPGVFIFYEISPIMIKIIEQRRSFVEFSTSICAIIGGVYTVASILDSMIYRSVELLKIKNDLGKLG